MTLLAERARKRANERLALFEETRERLRAALAQLAAGHRFWLFGSLTRRGQFNVCSDVDLAFESLPRHLTEYQLACELEECLGRPVDLVPLARTRLREKILCEGESWIA